MGNLKCCRNETIIGDTVSDHLLLLNKEEEELKAIIMDKREKDANKKYKK